MVKLAKVLACGAINRDITLFIERFPRVGEEVRVKEIRRKPGGTAANVAVATARVLGSGEAAFIGAVGDDDIGSWQIRILEDEEVVTSGVKIVEGVMSGQAYIVVDAIGKNIIHTFFGANIYLRPRDLEEGHRLDLIKESSVLVVMDPPMDTALRLLELGKKNGKFTLWDPGVYVEEGLNALLEPLQYADYLILSEVEYETLLETVEPADVGRKLSVFSEDIKAVVKMGGRGSAIAYGRTGRVLRAPPVPMERFGLRVVNTVGCGDAFIGAFASARALGLPDGEALLWGNCAGALKATRYETRGSPVRKELDALLSRVRLI